MQYQVIYLCFGFGNKSYDLMKHLKIYYTSKNKFYNKILQNLIIVNATYTSIKYIKYNFELLCVTMHISNK